MSASRIWQGIRQSDLRQDGIYAASRSLRTATWVQPPCITWISAPGQRPALEFCYQHPRTMIIAKDLTDSLFDYGLRWSHHREARRHQDKITTEILYLTLCSLCLCGEYPCSLSLWPCAADCLRYFHSERPDAKCWEVHRGFF